MFHVLIVHEFLGVASCAESAAVGAVEGEGPADCDLLTLHLSLNLHEPIHGAAALYSSCIELLCPLISDPQNVLVHFSGKGGSGIYFMHTDR